MREWLSWARTRSTSREMIARDAQASPPRTAHSEAEIEHDRDARRFRAHLPSSYRYSTNDIAAPSKPWILGLVDSMT